MLREGKHSVRGGNACVMAGGCAPLSLSALGLVILTCESPSGLSTMMLHKITKAAPYIDFFKLLQLKKKKFAAVGTIFILFRHIKVG